MSVQSAVVAEVERRYAEAMRLNARLHDLRVPGAALLLSGLLASATALALVAPWAWILVVGLLGAVALAFIRTRRSLAVTRSEMLDFGPIVSPVTEADRESLTPLPPYMLEAALVAHPSQLDRLLKPTRQDSTEQLREIPAQLVALIALGVLSMLGFVLSLAIPAIVVVGPGSLSSTPWVLIPFFAGVPLTLLVTHLDAVSGVTRELYALQVVSAEQELGRLWLEEPGFTTGRVVRLGESGYSIDHSALPIKPSSAVLSKSLRIILPVAFGLWGVLALLDELSAL